MPVVWHTSSTPDTAATDALRELLRLPSSARFLLLSGGSWFTLYNSISLPRQDYTSLTIMMIDERLSSEASINNALQCMQTALYRTLVSGGARFVDTTPRAFETVSQLAQRMESELRAWRRLHPAGVVIATLGVGADGHTAGILPAESQPFLGGEIATRCWFAGYESHGTDGIRFRATITPHGLRMCVHRAVVYVRGETKRAALSLVRAADGTIEMTPALVFHDLPHVELYTDIA